MRRPLLLLLACVALGGAAVVAAVIRPGVAPGSPAGADAAPAAAPPVNTVCAICGMPVDPKAGTGVYRGKVIGFGCRTCPDRFRADPERYGPAFLANRKVEE